MNDDPPFVMSMYANKADLFEAKAKYYMEETDKLRKELKYIRQCALPDPYVEKTCFLLGQSWHR